MYYKYLYKYFLRNKDSARVFVPNSKDWSNRTINVRKIQFSASIGSNHPTPDSVLLHPAPDPILLLAKSASNYMKRDDLLVLPGFSDDDSTSDSSDDVT